jgi:hypothetical protein
LIFIKDDYYGFHTLKGTKMKKITLIVYCLCFSMGLFAQTIQKDIPQLDTLKKLFKANSVSTSTYIKLPNGIKALTVVFRETRRSVGLVSQQAMNESPNNMKQIENNIQIWLISLADYPRTDGHIKNIIPPSKYPSEEEREMAFVGKGHGFAWFVFAPITKWIYMPKLLKLQGGDNPVDAALRGFATIRAWELLDYLRKSLPEAFPQIEKAIDNNHPGGYDIITNIMYDSDNEQIIQWLIRHSKSKEPYEFTARYCLIHKQKKEFIPMYSQWLTEDAGKRDVVGLLRACKAVQMSDLNIMLPVVLKSPSGINEYRLAFEMERELKGQSIPKDLLESEKKICNFGYKEYADSGKVDEAIQKILASNDYDAVAVIGLSLANYFAPKANWDDYDVIHKAGVRILKSLPDGKGLALVEQLVRPCKEYDKDRLKELSGFLKK